MGRPMISNSGRLEIDAIVMIKDTVLVFDNGTLKYIPRLMFLLSGAVSQYQATVSDLNLIRFQ